MIAVGKDLHIIVMYTTMGYDRFSTAILRLLPGVVETAPLLLGSLRRSGRHNDRGDEPIDDGKWPASQCTHIYLLLLLFCSMRNASCEFEAERKKAAKEKENN